MSTGLTGKTKLQGSQQVQVTKDHDDWVIYFCNFDKAWQRQPPAGGKQRGEGIVVVHPDTGYTRHPELLDGGRYVVDSRAKNFLDPPFLAENDLRGAFASHGTSTASVMMCGEGSPSLNDFPNYFQPNSVTGVAPSIEVIPCKVAHIVVLESASEAALAKAILYAIDLNENHAGQVGVISVSLGRPRVRYTVTTAAGHEQKTWESFGVHKSIRSALQRARDVGIVVCAAAGHLDWFGHRFLPTFPGSDPNTICVAACDADQNALDTGFYGEEVDVMAPGVDVWIAKSSRENRFARPKYEVWTTGFPPGETVVGTSYAAAVVAGACALWQGFHGREGLISRYGRAGIFDAFKTVLKKSCHTPVGWKARQHGAGILDADALLDAQLP